MIRYTVTDTELTSIANAIRTAGGTNSPLEFPSEFISAIGDIGGGGGGSFAPSKDVNFIDYDGTIVYSYTAAEFAELTAMPANPSHDGLTAQGWNWSLSDAQSYVADYGFLTIGQMYITSDGKTRIYIHLEEGRLEPYLGIAVNGTATVDWGDGTTSTVTGSSTTTAIYTQHVYSSGGDYVVAIAVEGSFSIVGSSGNGSYLLWKNTTATNANLVYQAAIKAVELGADITVGASAFQNCFGLTSITVPAGITSFGGNAFNGCCSLKGFTIPNTMAGAALMQSVFYGCSSLINLSIPPIRRFNNSSVRGADSLQSISIPSSATNISDYAFESCESLASITIPESIQAISQYAFAYCRGLGFIKFTSATPPAVSNSNAWSNLSTDCKIYVPTGSLSAYTTATNYPSSNTYTYVEY